MVFFQAPFDTSIRKLQAALIDRSGSKAALTTPKSDFRYNPESGLKSDIAPCPKSARRRREHLQQTVERLLNQFIGADQDRGRHNFRCKASSRRRVTTMATATPPMEMDGLS